MEPTGTFTLGPLIGEGRALIKGTKGTVFLMSLVVFILPYLIGIVAAFNMPDSNSLTFLGYALGAVGAALGGGFIAVGLYRASHLPVHFGLLGEYLKYAPQLILLGLIGAAANFLGELLLGEVGNIIVSVILVPAYLAGYFIVDRNANAIEGILGSYSIIMNNIGQMLLLLLFSVGMMLLAAVTLGIAAIWLMPLFTILGGLIYRDAAGIQSLPSPHASNPAPHYAEPA